MNDVAHTAGTRVFAGKRVGLLAATVFLALATTPGCTGFMHGQTGGLMISYSQEHMVPYLMGSSDVDMACATGVSMGAFLMSFGRVTEEPRRVSMVTLLSAGMCAEGDAWEAELRQLRALRAGNAGEARDARIQRQRHHAVAASRFYAAYQQLEVAFGTSEEGCPDLEEEDEIFYLLGLSAGMLALVHDRAAEGTAGVPMDTPQIVGRAAGCLDSDRWWGGPAALQASVWAMVPGAVPDGVDALEALATAAENGQGDGVRLARAFQVQILDANGFEDELKAAITAHAESVASTPSHPEWRLLDSYATMMIQHISDRIWTEDRGHRTPLGELGTFWEPPVVPETNDALFDDLFGSPEPEEGPSDNLGQDNGDEAPVGNPFDGPTDTEENDL